MSVTHDTPIQYLKGVGPHFAKVFSKRGISTVGELLEWYPRAYEDRRAARNISSLSEGEIVSLEARVVGHRTQPLGKSRRKIYDFVLQDETGRIHCKFFRMPFRGYFNQFEPGEVVRVAGKVTSFRGNIEFHHPDIQKVNKESDEDSDRLLPLYTETEGLSPRKLLNTIDTALKEVKSEFPETLPQWILEKYKLPTRFESLKNIHNPPETAGKSFIDLTSPYHRRIIFEEFFWLELFLAFKRRGIKKEAGPKLKGSLKSLSDVVDTIPFELTNAQLKSLNDILNDMLSGHPMHRMVQGDVGCGKTVVALLSSVFCIRNGYQVALMAPTEILAEQHFKGAKELLEPFGVNVELLTGHMVSSQQQKVYEKLESGEIDLCVGTHALIQKKVNFKNLGLAIVDEQHRFGVIQRKGLKQKGHSPHFLVMTATPIPRTLAMTVYGDLDISIINELPKGRVPIVTRLVFENKRPKVFEFMADQIQKGRQSYIVLPLVEESEKMDLKNATDEYEKLKKQFPKINFGLLHGKMKSREKEEIMAKFKNKEMDVLVSTTVIEVGVDVPNANLMIIEHAERFGLSQLHQLRGRVGRGNQKSYCVLCMGYASSQESKDRLKIMTETTDGFKISEADLEIRGPGEFLGARQSGLAGFKMANLVRDMQILQESRRAAFELIEKDPNLIFQEHQLVAKEFGQKHGKLSFAGVG